jgi:hypothetical protein
MEAASLWAGTTAIRHRSAAHRAEADGDVVVCDSITGAEISSMKSGLR